MIIAIDGPSGSGKGELAKRLAEKFNLAYLETGLLFRAIAFKLLQNNIPLEFVPEITAVAHSIKSEDLLEPALRSEEMASLASQLAVYPEIRQVLLDFQKNFASHQASGKSGVVLDGRDIGTKVLPHAHFKIFLTAHPEIRAQRRHKELQDRRIKSIYSNVLKDMRLRDERDLMRLDSPLKPAQGAYIVDTSAMQIDEVFERVARYIEAHKAVL